MISAAAVTRNQRGCPAQCRAIEVLYTTSRAWISSAVRIAATAPASSRVRMAASCALPPKMIQLPAHPATGWPWSATAEPMTSANGM